MRFFETFAGVGGFSLGITNAYAEKDLLSSDKLKHETKDSIEQASSMDIKQTDGLGCVGMSEIDKYASDVLRYHYPNVRNYGDITKIQWNTVPDFDLLVGGSPCQSFSIAGKRAGFNGASGLFWEYLHCLKEKKPDYFIWENVKGVLSSNGGRDFAVILNAFSEAGYALWWQILNAKDFGVPQNRERIFVVGSRNGCPREVLFEREHNQIYNESPEQRNDIAHTLNCGDKHRGSYVRTDEPSLQQVRSLPDNTNIRGGETYPANLRIRRLTPTECERLMSWPDNWTRYGRKEDGTVYEISDSQRYKMAGNGVCSCVVTAICDTLLPYGKTMDKTI